MLHHAANDFMVQLLCQVKSPSHTSCAEQHAVLYAFCSRAATPVTVTVHACWIARQGRTTPPCLFRHAATMLNIITLSSSSMSRRSCSSNSRIRSCSLVAVVIARLGTEHVETKPPAVVRLWVGGRAGGLVQQGQWCTPQPCPSQPMPFTCPKCVCHAVAPLVYTPGLAPLIGSGRRDPSSPWRISPVCQTQARPCGCCPCLSGSIGSSSVSCDPGTHRSRCWSVR